MTGTRSTHDASQPLAVLPGNAAVRAPGPLPLDDSTRLAIALSLQTSLVVDDLVEAYERLVRPALGLSGVRFRSADGADHRSGKAVRHRTSYRMTDEHGTLGTLTLYRKSRFAEADLAWIEGTLELLARPLRNAVLHEEALARALTDGLTGAGNRTALDATLPRQIEIARRHGQDLALLLVDIDHFKHINDSRGHVFGDEVLRRIVGTMQAAVRRSDAIYRFGGEEFVVLLSNTNCGGAVSMAERIRLLVAGMQQPCGGGDEPVTVSVEVTALQSDDTVRALLERVDQALYRAKAEGRNRCVFARDDRNVHPLPHD